jgi:hypothetical protein
MSNITVPEKKRSTFYIIGKAILFASMQFAIGSVEMSSKFSVKNFSKDQDTLDNAADALSDYILIGCLWTIGTSLIFTANYGWLGAFWNIVSNIAIILWIYISYMKAFKDASDKYKLEMPKLFRNFYITF